MKILVTGGLGFIGSNVVRQLLADGHQVTVVDASISYVRRTPADTLLQAWRISDIAPRIICNNHQTLFAGELAAGHDVVIHLAAVPSARECKHQPSAAIQTNLAGTWAMLKASAAAGVRRFVFVSSSFVYGDFDSDPIAETAPLKPFDMYAATKITGEIMVRNQLLSSGLEFVIVRPSAVYGFGDTNHRITQLLVEAGLRGDTVYLDGGGAGRLDFTHVTDLARGLVLAATHPKAANQIFNMTRGVARPVLEFATMVKLRLPGLHLDYAAADTSRPKRGALDITKARRVLGFNPTVDIEAGIESYVEGYRRERVVP